MLWEGSSTLLLQMPNYRSIATDYTPTPDTARTGDDQTITFQQLHTGFCLSTYEVPEQYVLSSCSREGKHASADAWKRTV